jgi:hypothetical protein
VYENNARVAHHSSPWGFQRAAEINNAAQGVKLEAAPVFSSKR